jgi:hypothetical protein
MKKLLTSFIVLLSLNAFAKINRCQLYNKQICANLTAEWGGRPNLAMIYFTKGIIEKESGWEEDSERTEDDGKTDYGLMHIQGPTARGIGLEGPERSLLQADIGLKYGIKYLVQKLKLAMVEAKKGKHSVWDITAASYNNGSIAYRQNGTLVSHREPLGNEKYLTYEEAVLNLAKQMMQNCRGLTIEQICQ